MSDPISDLIAFLTANTGDYLLMGWFRFVLLAYFYGLVAASVAFLFINWRDDPSQRTGANLWLWLARLFIGGMWFQGSLWKVPFTDNDGLLFWTKQEAGRAAYAVHRDLISNVVLPNFEFFHWLVFFVELGFATSLIVGLFVRLGGLGAALFTVNLWLGLYNTRPGDRPEWPWTYMFLILMCATFAAVAAGRALGADAWLRRNVAAVRDGAGLGGLIRLFT